MSNKKTYDDALLELTRLKVSNNFLNKEIEKLEHKIRELQSFIYTKDRLIEVLTTNK